MKKVSFSKNVYSFDIETETIEQDGKKYSYCFLGTFCKANIEDLILNPRSAIVEKFTLFRKITEIPNIIDSILESEKDRVIIYVHNLGYEWSFIFNNCYSWLTTHGFTAESILGNSVTKPFLIKLDNFELRCSYKATGMSIKNVGKTLGIPKLEFDYTSKGRTPESELNPKEIEYCYRDSELSLRAVANQCANYSWCKKVESIAITRTGFTRKNNRFASGEEIGKSRFVKHDGKYTHYAIQAMNCKSFNKDLLSNKNLFKINLASYAGGIVFSNNYFAGNIIDKQILHDDFSSEYPSVMCSYMFPTNFYKNKYFIGEQVSTQELMEKQFKYVFELANDEKRIPAFDLCITQFSQDKEIKETGFKLMIHVKNLILKKNGRNYFPLLPKAKKQTRLCNECWNFENEKCVQGRIMYAEDATITLNEIDLYIFLKCYSFSKIDLICGSWYKMRLNPYFSEIVGYYSKDKSNLKKCLSFFKNGKLENVENYVETVESLKWNSEMYYKIAKSCEYKLIKDIYGSNGVKGDLNGQYGINAELPIHEEFKIEKNESELGFEIVLENINTIDYIFNNEEKVNKMKRGLANKPTSYIYGSYITSYAHLMLFTAWWFVDKIGGTTLYCDTDSLFYFLSEEIDKNILLDFWNKNLSEKVKRYKQRGMNLYGLGTLDREEELDLFASLGAKNYLSLSKINEFKVTISGLHNATDTFLNAMKLKECDRSNFEKLIPQIYHYGTVFKSNKLTANYTTLLNKFDLNGDMLYSGCVLDTVNHSMCADEFKLKSDGKTIVIMKNNTARINKFIANEYFQNEAPLMTESRLEISADSSDVFENI